MLASGIQQSDSALHSIYNSLLSAKPKLRSVPPSPTPGNHKFDLCVYEFVETHILKSSLQISTWLRFITSHCGTLTSSSWNQKHKEMNAFWDCGAGFLHFPFPIMARNPWFSSTRFPHRVLDSSSLYNQRKRHLTWFLDFLPCYIPLFPGLSLRGPRGHVCPRSGAA